MMFGTVCLWVDQTPRTLTPNPTYRLSVSHERFSHEINVISKVHMYFYIRNHKTYARNVTPTSVIFALT